MGFKEDALRELEAVMSEFDLAPSTVGREIAGDANFIGRMRDTNRTISTNTLDSVWRYILKKRGQMELELDN